MRAAGAWKGWRFLGGPLATLGTILFAHVFWRLGTPEETIPGSALAPVLLAVVFSTFTGGRASGMASAALVTAYATAAFAQPGAPFHYTLLDLLKLGTITGCAFASVLLVGALKARADAAAEDALARERAVSQRERQSAAEAKAANETLRQNNETLETFVYVITHDLKEPVRAVQHHLGEVGEKYGTPEGRRELEEADQTNRRLGVLLQRLLEYSRASLTEPQLAPMSLHDVLDDASCRAIYEHTLRIRSARLDAQRDSPLFLADPVLLSQALGNLVLNAVKHNPHAHPEVRVLALPSQDAGFVDLVVQDNGTGFPPHVVRRVLALKQGRPATVAGGFGLAIVRRAVERNGGELRLRNLDEGGAEARIRLRAASGREESRRIEVTEPPARQTPPPA